MPSTPTAVALCAALTLTACGAQTSSASPAHASATPTTSVTAAAPAPLTAAQATTTAARSLTSSAVRAGRLAVGDSVLLGSRPRLKHRGFRVDAKVSRQFGSGVRIVRQAAGAGTLPRNVVVHLGTNGTVTLKACSALVRASGASRRVFLVTVRVPRPWQNSDNRALRRCDAAFAPARVQLVDWHRYSAGHRAWFGADRVHPSTVGRARYTALIDDAVDTRGL